MAGQMPTVPLLKGFGFRQASSNDSLRPFCRALLAAGEMDIAAF